MLWLLGISCCWFTWEVELDWEKLKMLCLLHFTNDLWDFNILSQSERVWTKSTSAGQQRSVVKSEIWPRWLVILNGLWNASVLHKTNIHEIWWLDLWDFVYCVVIDYRIRFLNLPQIFPILEGRSDFPNWSDNTEIEQRRTPRIWSLPWLCVPPLDSLGQVSW